MSTISLNSQQPSEQIAFELSELQKLDKEISTAQDDAIVDLTARHNTIAARIDLIKKEHFNKPIEKNDIFQCEKLSKTISDKLNSKLENLAYQLYSQAVESLPNSSVFEKISKRLAELESVSIVDSSSSEFDSFTFSSLSSSSSSSYMNLSSSSSQNSPLWYDIEMLNDEKGKPTLSHSEAQDVFPSSSNSFSTLSSQSTPTADELMLQEAIALSMAKQPQNVMKSSSSLSDSQSIGVIGSASSAASSTSSSSTL